MAKDKPVFVHKTFRSIRPEYVSEDLVPFVEKLEKDGYLLKVIVHDPEPGDAVKATVFATTVIATLSKNIDIGIPPQ